jgi:microcystin-dependent protein
LADPTTANTSMSVPIRGSDVGTWDVPVNGNFNILDNMLGGVVSFSPTNAPITMTSAQAQAAIIRLTGTLTGNVAITMANINKFWSIDNQLTNSVSSFVVTFVSTGGGSTIGAPPGTQDFYYDGTSLFYRNLGRVGEYWDHADTVVPSWVTACTKPPYLNCNGTTFSSATYPVLANTLGSNTLPDARGRFRAALNQTSSRILSSVGSLDGNTAYAAGGSQSITLATSQIPAHSHGVNDPTHVHGIPGFVSNALSFSFAGSGSQGGQGTSENTNAAPTGISIQNAGGGAAHANIPPSYIGGITMIRAA